MKITEIITEGTGISYDNMGRPYFASDEAYKAAANSKVKWIKKAYDDVTARGGEPNWKNRAETARRKNSDEMMQVASKPDLPPSYYSDHDKPIAQPMQIAQPVPTVFPRPAPRRSMSPAIRSRIGKK
jgi:hypothetical protein